MRHVYFRIILGIVFIVASIIAILQGQEQAIMTAIMGIAFLLSGISQYKKHGKGASNQ